MAERKSTRSGMHVTCPFCGNLCDGFVKLSFCSTCYAEYWPRPRKTWEFTFTDKPTGRQAWSKAIHKSGGVAIRGPK